MTHQTSVTSALREKLAGEIARLRPFLKAPAGRLGRPGAPDGGMALSDMRSLNILFHTKLKGNSRSAHFVISIINGSRIDNVVFVSGAEELRNAIAAIAATKFSQLSPDDTPIRILRKATFSCSIYTKDCFLVLMPVTDAVVPDPVIVSPATTN